MSQTLPGTAPAESPGGPGEDAAVCPYKGLVPYTEHDTAFFFGREHDSEVLAANLLASRLTLLYGPSGVGKTSVLSAGVVPALRRMADEASAARGVRDLAVIRFGGWRDDPLVGLAATLHAELRRDHDTVDDIFPADSRMTAARLQACTTTLDIDLLIILDQFEEYFLYHGAEKATADPEALWQ